VVCPARIRNGLDVKSASMLRHAVRLNDS